MQKYRVLAILQNNCALLLLQDAKYNRKKEKKVCFTGLSFEGVAGGGS